jgi:hypothetical protein
VHLPNEDTVPYTVHIGTNGQIPPNFAKNFVIYLYRFPKLQLRPKKKGNILRDFGTLLVLVICNNKTPEGELVINMLIYGIVVCNISLVQFKVKTCGKNAD